MKAPEKIYMPTELLSEEWTQHIEGQDIEYIRTGALIERAAIWFNMCFNTHDEYGVISTQFDTEEEMFEDFKNYIKGE